MFDTDLVQTCHGADVKTGAQRLLDNLPNTHKRKIMTRIQSPSYMEMGLKLDLRHPDSQNYTSAISSHLPFLFKNFLLNLLLLFSGKNTCLFYHENQNLIQPNFSVKQRTSVVLILKWKKKQQQQQQNLKMIFHSEQLPFWKWAVGADKGQKSSL